MWNGYYGIYVFIIMISLSKSRKTIEAIRRYVNLNRVIAGRQGGRSPYFFNQNDKTNLKVKTPFDNRDLTNMLTAARPHYTRLPTYSAVESALTFASALLTGRSALLQGGMGVFITLEPGVMLIPRFVFL